MADDKNLDLFKEVREADRKALSLGRKLRVGFIGTGGIAHSKMLTGVIRKYLEHTFNVVVMPGENEMEALAFGGLRILRGEEAANPAYV